MRLDRRAWLQLAGGAALSACVRQVPAPARGVHAVAFDLLAIFDPTTVDRGVAEIVRDRPAAFAATWKARLFEDTWQRAAAGRYLAFDQLVAGALEYASRAHRVDLAAPDRARLAAMFIELDPWPDARAVLGTLRARGLRLATLANFSPAMIAALLARADMAALFDVQLSTDEARTYKPDPRAYAIAEHQLGLPREAIAFAAFGGWDAAGGAWFGFPTFWVNRFAMVADELAPAVASGPDLAHLASWLEVLR